MEQTVHNVPTEFARPWPQSITDFEALVDALQHRLVHFAFCRLRSLADAEDVVQDVLVQAFRDRRKHSTVDNVSPFLFRMVANRCTDVLRRRKRHAGSLDDIEPPLPASGADTVPGLIDTASRLRWIEGLLNKLPQRQSQVIRLRVYADLPFETVARTLGCSVPTVKSRFRYGVQKLRSLLENARR